MRRLRSLLCLSALALAGCATAPSAPPPPLLSPFNAAYGYGYTDERIGPDLVRVVYQGPLRPLDPAGAPQLDRAANEAADLALWRAAQMTLAEGKPALAVVDRRTDTETVRRPAGWASEPWWPEYCYPRFSHQWGCRSMSPSYVPPAAEGRARATLTVRFERRVTPQNTDAAATVRRMENAYRSPPPS